MKYYNKLTDNRKPFINQLYTLVFNQFEAQNNILGNEKEIMEELENNPDFIQRIFIDASWGMGKTYFADSLVELVKDRNNNISEEEKKLEILRINAWESDYFADPMKSLIGELNEHRLINSETTEKAKEFLKGVGKELGIRLLKNLVLKKFNFTNDDISKIKEFFTGINESGLEEYKKYKNLVSSFKESLSLDKKRKIILIDELDRCRPNYAIELLETVKHIFGVKNIIFIFLVNKSQLKSTVSTMYLQEDECGEYFEKFFDIQFRLPDIDYEDFIKLEYEKYRKVNSYNVKNKISNEKDLYLESLFLDVFNSNYEYNFETTNKNKLPSIRSFVKAFNKYKLLLKSLNNEEKENYLVMILLVIYFLEKEFSWIKADRNLIYLKTFFTLKNGKNITKIYSESEIDKEVKCKYKYIIDSDIYIKFYKILYLETGKEFERGLQYSLVLQDGFSSKANMEIRLEDTIFEIEGLKNKIVEYGPFREIILIVKESYFSSVQKNNYSLGNSCYNINLLYEWCKEKYDFVIKSDLRR